MKKIYLLILILSIWHTILFLGYSYGLSVTLFMIPLLIIIITILRANNKIKNEKALLLIIPIILLSLTFFIFNSKTFRVLNTFTIPALLIFMFINLLNKNIDYAKIINNILKIIFKPFGCIMNVFKEIKISKKQKSNKKANVIKIIKSILITIPIIILIICLLSSADLIFKSIFGSIPLYINKIIFKLRITNIFRRIIGILIMFTYISSTIYYLINKYNYIEKTNNKNNDSKDYLTIKIVLSSLNIIYLIFCIIQIKSLFLHSMSNSINYSEYARQGFFQLIAVSIINLIIIIQSKRNQIKNNIKDNKYIKIMNIFMIIFTFIILISSFMRMNLYESEYGYTILRLLVYVSLITESIMLIPTVMYILDKNINLIKTYLTIIISMYTLVNFINFDNLIAKRNIDRYFNKNDIDLYYIKETTNTDCIDQINRLYRKTKDKELKKETYEYMKSIKYKLNIAKTDFRNLNISKLRAKTKLNKIIKYKSVD